MAPTFAYDAIVIGSGPNGLAAAVTIARARKSVLLLEANDKIGGATRSAEITLSGFSHDICSAVHPMAAASPFFRSLPLDEHGLRWIHPPLALAHPFDNGDAALLHPSLDTTKRLLGPDARGYQELIGCLVKDWPKIETALLACPLAVPTHPLLLSRFALHALQPATRVARSYFKTEKARALFAGLAAHSLMPLDSWGTAAIGLVLAAQAHLAGWPIAQGGSQKIADALASYLCSLGGEIRTRTRVTSTRNLPPARIILCDLSPRGLLEVAREDFPSGYCRSLEKFDYGPGVFKIDWVLQGPIPWKNSDVGKAGTVHLGGTLEEIGCYERALCSGQLHNRPFVLLSQPTLFDSTRISPSLKGLTTSSLPLSATLAISDHGARVMRNSWSAATSCHIAWAYCHVPANSTVDMTRAIESQIERFAPGFQDLILARSTKSPGQLEIDNANLVGGNISGGANSLRQLFLRPTLRAYVTPAKHIFLCSASTPPGGGVHGMCGHHAARLALLELSRKHIQ